jgi:hypothetical protein
MSTNSINSANHYPTGNQPQEIVRFLPDELMADVEANVVYACTDVVLRDSSTGHIFLGERQIEPQKGPWFIGGRNYYGKGFQENAELQVRGDLHMVIDSARFSLVTTDSTPFPAASPGREDHGRHTVNTVMSADLSPDEVAELNQHVASGDVRKEYSSGQWYDPKEITNPNSDFAYPVKDFVRHQYAADLLMRALREEAEEEDKVRMATKTESEMVNQSWIQASINSLSRMGFDEDTARSLVKTQGQFATAGAYWIGNACHEMSKSLEQIHRNAFGYSPTNLSPSELLNLIVDMFDDDSMGDYHILKKLESHGVARPNVISDNGPALQGTLKAAEAMLPYVQNYDEMLPRIAQSSSGYYSHWALRNLSD